MGKRFRALKRVTPPPANDYKQRAEAMTRDFHRLLKHYGLKCHYALTTELTEGSGQTQQTFTLAFVDDVAAPAPSLPRSPSFVPDGNGRG